VDDWAKNNPEKNRAKTARYRAAHPGKNAAASARYRAAHPGKASARAKQRRAENPEWAKARDAEANARRLYGISAEEHRARLSRPCEICGNFDERSRAMHVDHDHETGKLRGTLCHNCNVSIGLMKESQERLIAAAQYLAKYEVT